MKFYYSVNEKPDEEDYRLEYEDDYYYENRDLWVIVQELADHYFHNHDGWDHNSWPNDFYIWNEKHEYLGKFVVDMETEPRFHASKVEDDD